MLNTLDICLHPYIFMIGLCISMGCAVAVGDIGRSFVRNMYRSYVASCKFYQLKLNLR